MNPEIIQTLAALGADLTPQMLGGTGALFGPLVPPMPEDVGIARDLAYGPDERHLLDIMTPPGAKDAPVLVFVHGGGFIMGNKTTPGSPFYDNVAAFAARNGMVGVNMTYRLAPASRWPGGADDMAQAVDWLRAHVADYGGDPARIYLMGQSAGAVHVASYLAWREARIAGAIMVSGLYDIASAVPTDMHRAYYGDDLSTWPNMSNVAGMIASQVPQMLSVCEYDPVDFHKQAASLAAAWAAARGAFPRLHWLRGHNHLSPAVSLGTSADTLGPLVLDFIADTAPHGE